MPRLEKTWQIAGKITPEADQNLAAYPNLLRQVLFNRGLAKSDESQRFLSAIAPELGEPLLMKGMAVAVDRLERAIKQSESIVVYGDYDADGVTATALLVQCLQSLGGKASDYIPDRFEEGYGLNIGALRQLKEQGANVVVSVDCGVRSLAEADEAKRLGLDLIITDHHTPGPELPNAFALINTKQEGDEYPEKQLAGVGTAFKLASALIKHMRPNDTSQVGLDLVALGTVADMVPLTGENRWLVRAGLAQIRQPHRQRVAFLDRCLGIKSASHYLRRYRLHARPAAQRSWPHGNCQSRLPVADHSGSFRSRPLGSGSRQSQSRTSGTDASDERICRGFGSRERPRCLIANCGSP